ncbi:MAG: hypothetical protein AB7I08_11330 [Thermoleophilia bacterium]
MRTRTHRPRGRRLAAAVSAVAAGVAVAATAGTASAASQYTCINPESITQDVDLDVTFANDFPDVVVGQPFGIQPVVRYSFGNGYLQDLADAGILAPGENNLNGMTFWVAVSASNTVEERQIMRATVNASANTRVFVDGAGDVEVRRYTGGVLNGTPTPNLAGTATLNTTGISWTPKSAGPVTFSVAQPGGLGQIPVNQQWLRNNATANAPTGPNANEYLTAARPYGQVYVRLRLGEAGANGGGVDPVTVVDSGGRSSLDCVAGNVYEAGGLYATGHPAAGTPILYSEAGNVVPGLVDPPAGDRGRYTVNASTPPAIASVTPDAAVKPFVCVDGLGRFGLGREINGYDIKVTTPDPGKYTTGQPYTLKGVGVEATISSVMIKALYSNLLSYESLPSGGHLDQPLTMWLAITGANTVQGTQVVKIEGRWQASFTDPDGVSGSGDETFPASIMRVTAPDTTWTPTGAGDVSFSVAAPGQIPTLTLTGRGHSGDAGAIFPMNPYGSLFVRAETGRYGASIDCLQGTIRIANAAIAFSNLGRGNPDVRIPTPVAAGAPPSANTVPSGSAGRYAIAHTPSAPFAVVPANAPAAAVTKAKTGAAKPKFTTLVRRGKVYLRVTATLPRTQAGRTLVIQRKVGKRTLTVGTVRVPRTGKVSKQILLKSGTKAGSRGVKGAKSIRLRVRTLPTATALGANSAFKAVAVKRIVRR